MSTVTSYGTWCNRVNLYSTSPDADVNDAVNGGDPEWRERIERTGALDEMKTAYRAAINAALPPDVNLCGDEFVGPWRPDADAFDGYPKDGYGGLDIAAAVAAIDLYKIIEQYDPDSEDGS